MNPDPLPQAAPIIDVKPDGTISIVANPAQLQENIRQHQQGVALSHIALHILDLRSQFDSLKPVQPEEAQTE